MPQDIDRESLPFALRQQSHSFMNDLQVISGWLQLGNVQKALDHIEISKERVRKESLLMSSLGPGLYGWLRFLEYRVQASGAVVEIETPPETDYSGWRPWRPFEEAVLEIACWMAKRGCTQMRLSLRVVGDRQAVAIEPLGGGPSADDIAAGTPERSRDGVAVRLSGVSGRPAVIIECVGGR